MSKDKNKRDWNLALAAATIIMGVGVILSGDFMESKNTKVFQDTIKKQMVIEYDMTIRVTESDDGLYRVVAQTKDLDMKSWDKMKVVEAIKARIQNIFDENYPDREIIEIKRTMRNIHLRRAHFLITTKKAG